MQLACIKPVLAASSCHATDFGQLGGCICRNTTVMSAITECCFTICNYTEVLGLSRAFLSLNNLLKVNYSCDETREVAVRRSTSPYPPAQCMGACAVFAVLVSMFVGLRILPRYTISKESWWDDWLLLASTVSANYQDAIVSISTNNHSSRCLCYWA